MTNNSFRAVVKLLGVQWHAEIDYTVDGDSLQVEGMSIHPVGHQWHEWVDIDISELSEPETAAIELACEMYNYSQHGDEREYDHDAA